MKAKKFTVLLIALCVTTLILSTVFGCKEEAVEEEAVEEAAVEEVAEEGAKEEAPADEEKPQVIIHVLLDTIR